VTSLVAVGGGEMNLAWTLSRLRSMTPAEIADRCWEKAKKLAAKTRLEGWARYQSEGPAPALPRLTEYVAGFNGEARRECVGAAARSLAGRFRALGREWPRRSRDDLFPTELWRLDPLTGRLWPGAQTYCFDIPYRSERERGDVKYVWEINRLQFLHPLAATAFLNGDVDALAAIEAAIVSWHAANPPFRGVAWSSGIEIALRAISLLIVSSLLADKLDRNVIARIRAILSASLLWLARYPSLHSSANNHRIAEAAGVYLISLAMPEPPYARRLHRRSRRVLEAEAQKQILGDGAPAEQSPSYGAFGAECLLLCHASAPIAGAARARLDRFADFIFWLADAKGGVPAIGDDDEGRVLCFAPPHGAYAFAVASRVKASFEPYGIRIFREGGLSVIRNARWRLAFDHGPLGYLAIAAHGHADALSLSASLDGEPLLVDPGTYCYAGGAERDWFRGTPAHNTLNIHGENQSRISGPFNWSHKARCRLDEADEGAPWRIAASHDGYQKRFGVRHQRSISEAGGGFWIEDRLLGGEREAEIVFQLAADLAVEIDGAVCRISRADRPIAILSFASSGALSLRQGAVSPAFGVKVNAPRIVWVGQIAATGARVSIAPA
jgi:hypothetical protein